MHLLQNSMRCHCSWEEGAGLPAPLSAGVEISPVPRAAAGSQHSSPEQKVRAGIAPGEQQSLFISPVGSGGVVSLVVPLTLHVLQGQEIKDVMIPALLPRLRRVNLWVSPMQNVIHCKLRLGRLFCSIARWPRLQQQGSQAPRGTGSGADGDRDGAVSATAGQCQPNAPTSFL